MPVRPAAPLKQRLVVCDLQPPSALHQGDERRGAGAAALPLSHLRRGQLGSDREERVPHHLRRAAGVDGRGRAHLQPARRGPGRDRHPAGVHQRLPRPLRGGDGIGRRGRVRRLGELRD